MTATTKTRARLIVVDDHAIVRQGLRELLRHEPDIELCGEAEDLADAMRLIESERPDLVIADISLRQGHGLDLIRQVMAKFPETRILVLSMHNEWLYAERALRAGASGYVSKHEPMENLVDAIRRVLAGGVYLSGRSADHVLGRLVGKRKSTDEVSLDQLSDREMEVLNLLGRGHGTREIAGQLSLSPRTIDAHRENIKKKLGLNTAAELFQFAVLITHDRLGES
jgi:DNA-binding NarL/FixJ family response regulator